MGISKDFSPFLRKRERDSQAFSKEKYKEGAGVQLPHAIQSFLLICSYVDVTTYQD